MNNTVYCVEFAISDGEAFDKITELLFSHADTVCLHAEQSDLNDKAGYYADLSAIIGEAQYSKEVTYKGKKVLRLGFSASDTVKNYFLSIRTLCANLKDCTLKYAPFIYFTDTLFLRGGERIASFTLSDNNIQTTPGLASAAADIYRDCMYRDPLYNKIKENFHTLPESRKRYFIDKGFRLIKNLYIYLEREKLSHRKPPETEKLKALIAYLPKSEWLSVAAYKKLIFELFPREFDDELAFAEDFVDVYRHQMKIERATRKLEFYLANEAGTPPRERSYVS